MGGPFKSLFSVGWDKVCRRCCFDATRLNGGLSRVEVLGYSLVAARKYFNRKQLQSFLDAQLIGIGGIAFFSSVF